MRKPRPGELDFAVFDDQMLWERAKASEPNFKATLQIKCDAAVKAAEEEYGCRILAVPIFQMDKYVSWNMQVHALCHVHIGLVPIDENEIH